VAVRLELSLPQPTIYAVTEARETGRMVRQFPTEIPLKNGFL
jgi:hypothetical protein